MTAHLRMVAQLLHGGDRRENLQLLRVVLHQLLDLEGKKTTVALSWCGAVRPPRCSTKQRCMKMRITGRFVDTQLSTRKMQNLRSAAHVLGVDEVLV